jgi:hypothetical protein
MKDELVSVPESVIAVLLAGISIGCPDLIGQHLIAELKPYVTDGVKERIRYTQSFLEDI